MQNFTEAPSPHRHLETRSIHHLLHTINQEDQSVPRAVEQVIPAIELLVTKVVAKLRQGGRLFYLGAGTSGRLGVLDASECPPTFGVSEDLVIGLIAGGDSAIRRAVENAEDDQAQAWLDLQEHFITPEDIVIGVAASGTTPYVVSGLANCRSAGIATGCITCNLETPLAQQADFPVEVVVGPEFVTGSTRMKAGTAQKLVLNMISTSVMIQLGRVRDNRMVDMQLSNAKLVDRGVRMIVQALGLTYAEAKTLLLTEGSVRGVLERFQ